MLKANLVLVPLLGLVVTGCGDPRSDEKKKWESSIRQSIELPQPSLGSKYSKYYYYDGESEIDAVYIVQDQGLQEIVKNECHLKNSIEYPCNQSDYGIIGPHESRWVDKKSHLPVMSGGGCYYIEIKFDVRENAIKSMKCNGSY